MKLSIVLIPVIIINLFIANPVLLADKYSEKDVKKVIDEVNTKLNVLIEDGAEFYAAREISKIDEFRKKALKNLAGDERDMAYYEIMKAKAYFRLIEAKKYLKQAEMEYENAQSTKKEK